MRVAREADTHRVRLTEPQSPAAVEQGAIGRSELERCGAMLSLRGVSKRVGRRWLLRDVDLDLEPGESLALVGENGAGKSTLVRMIAGVDGADEGNIDVRGRIGYCPQEPGLLDLLTADEHLVFFGRGLGLDAPDARERGRELLAEFGFRGPQLDVVSRHLSGGSRQKLNLALALLGDPDVLLLDEPYTGFDGGTYLCFWQHVERWQDEGRACLVVTHFLGERERVDRVHELVPYLEAAA
jgi:ABC-type multidrug transport system ATPase subunit